MSWIATCVPCWFALTRATATAHATASGISHRHMVSVYAGFRGRQPVWARNRPFAGAPAARFRAAGGAGSRALVTPGTRIETALEYRLTAEPAAVAEARAAVTEALDGGVSALPREARDAIRLAVTEICANVVRHAYAPGRPGELWLTIALADGVLDVGVRDFGRGMRATSAHKGVGLGMHIA